MGNDIGGHSQRDVQGRHQQHAHSGPPPASNKVLQKYLTPIHITADDLLEETNKECAVCLGDQLVGDLAAKLPCGHLFHVGCVEQWLRLHCTCPVCRFELETDDRGYEQERKDRMQKRKMRCRRDELENKSIGALKEMMNQLNIDTAHCYEKRDLVDRLVASGRIEIVEGAPVLEITEHELGLKPIAELKQMMLSFGISTAGALEKRDLINRLTESGRVLLIIKVDEDINSFLPPQEDTAFFLEPHKALTGTSEIRHVLQEMSVEQLLQLYRTNNVSSIGLLDKSELIDRYLDSIDKVQEHADFIRTSTNIGADDDGYTANITFYQETALHTAYTSTLGTQAYAADSNIYGPEKMDIVPPAPATDSFSTSYSSPSKSETNSMSVKELKSICTALCVSIDGCLDKEDIITRLKESGHNI